MTYDGPGTTPARREAFLRNGPEMVEFLERAGMTFVYADGWSDYYDDLPGGEPRGRSLIAELFDIRELGDWAPKLSRYPGFALPMNADEFPDLLLVKRTLEGKQRAATLAWRMLKHKLTGKQLVGAGAAIQGRMLQIALREQLPIWTESPVTDLIVEAQRAACRGVVVAARRQEVRVGARRWRADQRGRLLAQRGDARAISAAATRPSGPTRTRATPAR